MASPTVLVLGGELGFMFALSVELSRRQISLYPTRTAREARTTLARHKFDPDVLIINCGSPGACTLAEEVAKRRPDVRIVAIVSDTYQCKKCGDRVAARFREDEGPARIRHCADVIEGLVQEQLRQSRQAGGN